MTRAHTPVDSPLGPLVLVDEDGELAGLYVGTPLPGALTGPRDDAVLPALREQLAAYFAGQLTAFDVPVVLHGTPFQQRVWAALRDIPYGSTRTYGEVAAAVGAPTAARAVGLANGRNPVCLVVPCHRVVGAGGRLVGYVGGLERKRLLLDLEKGALPL